MLTQEQIDNLKEGDPIVIHAAFDYVDNDGDVRFLSPCSLGNYCNSFISPDCVSLPSEQPKPKYDPTRLFKKGDKVKLTKWNGRICEKLFRKGIFCGENLTVVRDEDCFLNVTVSIKQGLEIAVLSPFLELVTPVDERNPYSVHEESTLNRWNVIKDKYVHGIHAMFPYKNIGNSDLMSREEAKARADEYCDLLNAEWRKEQS